MQLLLEVLRPLGQQLVLLLLLRLCRPAPLGAPAALRCQRPCVSVNAAAA
jgi:hypothetical protein